MKAMILAAGYGKRLRPITLTIPKPLVQVAGQPLITYHIQRLAKAGFHSLVINHGWLGEKVEEALGDGSQWGVSIAYSAEKEPLETAGGIIKALPLLADTHNDVSPDETPFLVLNGDVYTDIELNHLTLPEGMLAHLVMVDNPEFHSDGDFNLINGQISLKEESASTKALTFSGVSVLSPRLFAGYRAGETLALAPLLKDAMKQGKVSGQYHDGFWADVGSIVRLQALEDYLQRNHPS